MIWNWCGGEHRHPRKLILKAPFPNRRWKLLNLSRCPSTNRFPPRMTPIPLIPTRCPCSLGDDLIHLPSPPPSNVKLRQPWALASYGGHLDPSPQLTGR